MINVDIAYKRMDMACNIVGTTKYINIRSLYIELKSASRLSLKLFVFLPGTFGVFGILRDHQVCKESDFS